MRPELTVVDMVMALIAAGLLGSLAICVRLARCLRHDYDRSHCDDAPQRWNDRMLGTTAAQSPAAVRSPAPEARPSKAVLPQANVHPLIAGFAISTHALAYSAINAAIAHLVSRRVVEVAAADIVRGPDSYLDNFLHGGSTHATMITDMLLIHGQRRTLVHDSLDCAVFDALVGLADLEAKNLWNPPEVYGELPAGTKLLVFSQLVHTATSAPNTYWHVLKKLEDASAEAIRARGFDEDAELQHRRAQLKRASIVCGCLCGVTFWASAVFMWLPGLFLPLIAGAVLLFYCSTQSNHCRPLSAECMRLQRELDGLACWLDASEDEDAEALAKSLDADSWHQLALYATVVGKGAEVARLMRHVAPELAERVDFRDMLAWCDHPAQVANETFMEATRQTRSVRANTPKPQPYF